VNILNKEMGWTGNSSGGELRRRRLQVYE